MMVSSWQRRLFDQRFDAVVAGLPEEVLAWLEEVPVIIEDEPSGELLGSLGMDPAVEDLCGLHDGVALTQRSVEGVGGEGLDQIMLFRGPILRLAAEQVPGTGPEAVAEIQRQIRITLLHEVGHHFGLDEDDLQRVGYA